MACFMERKVDEVKKTSTCIIGLHRGENKSPSPYEDDKKNENPATEVKGISFRLNKKDKLLEKTTSPRCIFFFGDGPPQCGPLVSSIFFKNNAAS